MHKCEEPSDSTNAHTNNKQFIKAQFVGREKVKYEFKNFPVLGILYFIKNLK